MVGLGWLRWGEGVVGRWGWWGSSLTWHASLEETILERSPSCIDYRAGAVEPRCAHMQYALSECGEGASSLHKMAIGTAGLLRMKGCTAASFAYDDVVRKLATAIDMCIFESDLEIHFLKMAHIAAASGKRRRIDGDFKQHLMETLSSSRASHSASQAMRPTELGPSMGRKWGSKYVLERLTTGKTAFTCEGVVSIAYDGSTNGKPGESNIVSFLWDAAIDRGQLLPLMAQPSRARAL